MIFGSKRYRGVRSRSKKKSAAARQAEREHLLSASSSFFVREAYKTLRTNVSFSLTGEERCKVIVVTSSTQGEGKSVTAVNLATSYAMTDCRVLVVDCDMRRPKLSRLLGISSKIGLSNVLMRPELISEAVLQTNIQGLDVILSGDIPPNPSELLGSVRMERLLSDLRKKYDYIILDSPPVNIVTDSVVLAPKSDGVLFLVRANCTDRHAVLHAVEQLDYANAKILGFVLNDVDLSDTPYAGRYRRGSYYSNRYYTQTGKNDIPPSGHSQR